MDDVSDAGAQLLVGLDLLLQAQLLGAQHVQLVRDPRQEFLLKERKGVKGQNLSGLRTESRRYTLLGRAQVVRRAHEVYLLQN